MQLRNIRARKCACASYYGGYHGVTAGRPYLDLEYSCATDVMTSRKPVFSCIIALGPVILDPFGFSPGPLDYQIFAGSLSHDIR